MISDDVIKQKIEETILQISKCRLSEKMKLFQHIDLPTITIKFIKKPQKVSRKRLRLYVDLVKEHYSLAKYADNYYLAGLISECFKCVCTKKDLDKLRPFKEITVKKVITMKDDNVKTINVLRWRYKGNRDRNRLHYHI
jgi:hypothetical protein